MNRKERLHFLNIIDYASYFLKHFDISRTDIITEIRKELDELENLEK